MKVGRLIILAIFTILFILFTVGFTTFPLINLTNIFFKASLYTNKIDFTILNTELGNLNDISNSVNDEYQKYAKYLYISSIITSCLIIGGVLLSLISLKRLSKLLFAFAQLFMIIFTISILVLYYSSYITKIIPFPDLPGGVKIPDTYKNISQEYGTGAYLIGISSVGMIINSILYNFLG